MIHVYDLESGELIAYQSPVGEEWSFALIFFRWETYCFHNNTL